MNRHIVVILCSAWLIFLSECSEKSGPVRGFVLPQGDAEKGQQVFVDFKCYRGHSSEPLRILPCFRDRCGGRQVAVIRAC